MSGTSKKKENVFVMDDVSLRNFPIPFQEQDRIEDLLNLDILDTEPEPEFDRITRLAAFAMRAPVAVVTLVDKDRQWFKSCFGLDVTETPRDIAFCAHTIMSDELLIVPDATKDPRFSNNPLVTEEPNVRFYAGAPIVSENGFRLGSVCVVDFEPHPMPDPEALQALRDLADLAAEAIILRARDNETAERLARSRQVADNSKNAFLAMMSHELRTPLNAIIGFTDLIREKLRNDNPADEHIEYADLVEKSGHDLLTRIESMLNWTQIQRGEMELNDTQVSLIALVENCRNSIPELVSSNIEVTVSVDGDDAEPTLICDLGQIEHAVGNILKNAVQAAPDSSKILVKIDASEGLRLSVLDTGPGMSSESLDRAMEVFSHPDENPFHTQNGIGLGLPLARRIVEMHGGHFEIASVIDQGTTVTMRFPEYRRHIN